MLETVRDTLWSARLLRGLTGVTEDLGENFTALERQLETKQDTKQHLNWQKVAYLGG